MLLDCQSLATLARVSLLYFQLRRDLDSGKISAMPDSEGHFRRDYRPTDDTFAFSQSATEWLLFESKASRWSRLASGELFADNLWSGDGKYVYVRINSTKIVRVSAPGGKMEEVVSLQDLPEPVDMFAGWIGLTPDNEPIVIRDRSTQEIYALDLQ